MKQRYFYLSSMGVVFLAISCVVAHLISITSKDFFLPYVIILHAIFIIFGIVLPALDESINEDDNNFSRNTKIRKILEAKHE